MNRSRPTRQKHDRERAKRQKQQDKAARRTAAKTDRPERPASGEDPDIAGIQPGPQPPPWDD